MSVMFDASQTDRVRLDKGFFRDRRFAEDLKKFDVPTLILHGDDEIVPTAPVQGRSGLISHQSGAPHGMCSTLKA
jgi:pimeloyl-ACP methyl ester carboxylesterase